jgi:thioredoxin
MKYFLLYVFIAFSITSCKSQNKADCEQAAQTSAFVLDVNTFEEKLNNNKDAILLDVRTPDEYANGYIGNAGNIDYYEDFKNKIAKIDKNATYFVYCKAGSRSASAADIMRKNGFKEVYELKGGIMAWENAGKPLTNASAATSPGMSVENFDKLLKSTPVVLVDFNAKWCAPCKKMAPMLDELSAEYKEKATVQKIDVDENKTLVTSLQIQGLPLLILYKNGKEVWRKNEYTEKPELKEKIDAALR